MVTAQRTVYSLFFVTFPFIVVVDFVVVDFVVAVFVVVALVVVVVVLVVIAVPCAKHRTDASCGPSTGEPI